MNTATRVNLPSTNRMGADQQLYRLDPPFVSTDEDSAVEGLIEYVIVSAVFAFGGPETYIFPADVEGDILDFGELEGSFQGDLDHERALKGMGYEVFNNDVVESTVVEEKELES